MLKEYFLKEPKRKWVYYEDSQEGGPEFVHFTDHGRGFKQDAVLKHDGDHFVLELIDNKKTIRFNSAEELVTHIERFLGMDKLSVDKLKQLSTVTEAKRGKQ